MDPGGTYCAFTTVNTKGVEVASVTAEMRYRSNWQLESLRVFSTESYLYVLGAQQPEATMRCMVLRILGGRLELDGELDLGHVRPGLRVEDMDPVRKRVIFQLPGDAPFASKWFLFEPGLQAPKYLGTSPGFGLFLQGDLIAGATQGR